MNWQQLFFMWCGIAAILFCAFFAILEPYRPDYDYFAAWVFLIALVTGGLIVSFKGKKAQVKLNAKKGIARIICVLSALAFVGWCIFGAYLYIDETQRNIDQDSWVAFVLAFISAAILWIIYLIVFRIIAPTMRWIMRWIAKGFEGETESKDNDLQ